MLSPIRIQLALAAVALSLASCATDRQVIQQAEDTHAQLKPAVMDDPELFGYLKSMGDRIVAAAKELDAEHYGPSSHFEKNESNDWMFSKEEFHLVNSKTLNAFTTGGEHLYIYAELMQKCRTEDELGFAFYTRAGWDPAKFGDFFQQMIDMGYDTTPAYMSDHPTLKSRVDAAKKRAAALPPDAAKEKKPPIADAAKFAELKKHAAEVGKKMPTDEQLKKAQTLLAAVPSCLLPVDQPEQKAAQEKLREAVAAEQNASQSAK